MAGSLSPGPPGCGMTWGVPGKVCLQGEGSALLVDRTSGGSGEHCLSKWIFPHLVGVTSAGSLLVCRWLDRILSPSLLLTGKGVLTALADKLKKKKKVFSKCLLKSKETVLVYGILGMLRNPLESWGANTPPPPHRANSVGRWWAWEFAF